MLVKDFICTNFSAVDADVRIVEIVDQLKTKHFVVVFSNGEYVGIIYPTDALGHERETARSCCRNDLACFDTDDATEKLRAFFERKVCALPVLASKNGKFLGVFTFEYLDRARLGIANVTVSETVGPVMLEDAKLSFFRNVSGAMRDPLQRIASLSNILKHVDNEDSRLLLCYSIEAAVDQINKSFEIYLRETAKRLENQKVLS